MRESLLDACIHNPAYDRQLEYHHANWLLRIVDLTGEWDFYIDRILQSLPNETDHHDVSSILTFAAEAAGRHDARARKAIYDKLEGTGDYEITDLVAEKAMELDGVTGLLRVAEVIGKRLLTEPDFEGISWIIDTACERFGEERTFAALHEHSGDNAFICSFLNAAEYERRQARENAGEENRCERKPTYEAALASIETGQGLSLFSLGVFGRRASKENADAIFRKLLAESDRDKVLRYLWVFRSRQLPQLHARIFEIAGSHDTDLREAAIVALSNISDPAVRQLGLTLLETDKDAVEMGALDLFIRNYRSGDNVLIEKALPRTTHRGILHGVSWMLGHTAVERDNPELSKCLIWVYENAPCSHCRFDALRLLVKWNRAPQEFLREALWDSNEDTVELARSALGPGR